MEPVTRWGVAGPALLAGPESVRGRGPFAAFDVPDGGAVVLDVNVPFSVVLDHDADLQDDAFALVLREVPLVAVWSLPDGQPRVRPGVRRATGPR